MKYNQPYGISDPDAPYINGNPSTGTMGSIPPAASIEHPQREIANFIADARLTPSANDLHQLGKGVQSNGVIYCDDQGTENQLVITLDPPVTVLIKGMVFIVKSPRSNSGPATLKVNSLAPVAIVRASDQHALDLGDISPDSLQAYGYDGTSFQMVWTQRQPGAPIYLTNHRTYYVNGTTGSDSFDGTTQLVGSGHGPFLTIQRAANEIVKYNQNGYNMTVNVADGTYAHAMFTSVNGSGSIILNGNVSNPDACIITGTNLSGLWILTKTVTYVNGFTFNSIGTPSSSDGMAGVYVSGGGTVLILGTNTFGSCLGAHIYASFGAMVSNNLPATWKITGNALGNIWLPGHFCRVYATAQYQVNAGGGPTIDIPVALAFAHSFMTCDFSAMVMFSATFTGVGVGGCTGRKFYVNNNSSINSGGGGVNVFPGNQAGIADASTGGYYT